MSLLSDTLYSENEILSILSYSLATFVSPVNNFVSFRIYKRRLDYAERAQTSAKTPPKVIIVSNPDFRINPD